MSSTSKSVVFFVLCFSFGLSIIFNVSDKISSQRDPAAINGKLFQITSLTSDEIKQQISKKIKVFPTTEGKKTIALNGFSSSLCKNYQEVEMEFQAEGVAVAGNLPTMKVTSPCEAGQDPSEMASLEFPVDKLLNEKVRNAEFKFAGFKSKVEFMNVSDEWPKQWVLKSVQFKSSNGKNKSAQFERMPASESTMPVVLEF